MRGDRQGEEHGDTSERAPRGGPDWFDEARLGLFVHWDHASQQGLELSWPLVGGAFALPHCQSVTVEQYHSSATTFEPREWDPGALARLARSCGMGYVVFTAKHHSGYAMYDTAFSDFSVMHSPCGRDLLAETVAAVRDEGLRVGIYFSLSDWRHPDYPAFTEAHKPYMFGASPPLPTDEQWERYLGDMFGQVRELLTGYGRVDVLWFDGGWERPAPMWRPKELEEMIRSLQPEVLVNDRLPGVGDFSTPEQFVPARPPDGRWETCLTMNESWGYNPGDCDYKSARQLVHTVCEVTGKGGNLLLNVSPTGTGALPREQTERLEMLATWMRAGAESVKGTKAGLESWQFYGPSTRRGGTVYLHLVMRPYGTFTVRGLPVRRVRKVTELASGAELEHRVRTGIIDSLTVDPLGEITISLPEDLVDPMATVVALQIEDR